MTHTSELPTSPAVIANGVDKFFGALQVLKNVSFTVQPGEVVALLGPSGAGKSTMLRCINHLEKIDGGQVSVHGELIGYQRQGDRLMEMSDKRISEQRTSIGMVFQSFNLFRHMTVLENIITAPMMVHKRDKADAIAHAHTLLKKVGLPDKASFYPSQLSGGQQQRVAIARALAMEPEVLLLDEPTSALDPELSHEVIGTIKTLADEGRTMLITTHEMAIARGFSDRVIFMVDGEVAEDVPAKQFFETPRHERSRQFLAQMEN